MNWGFIRLTMPEKRVTVKQRTAVAKRADDCCEYCLSQSRFSTQRFSVENITPRSRGGKTALDNLAFACQGCNGHKATKTVARDPATGEIVSLYDPHRQNWHEHFAWIDEFAVIVGLSPTGRATIEALRSNRENLINLRRILYTKGVHPPAKPADI